VSEKKRTSRRKARAPLSLLQDGGGSQQKGKSHAIAAFGGSLLQERIDGAPDTPCLYVLSWSAKGLNGKRLKPVSARDRGASEQPKDPKKTPGQTS